MFLFSLVHLTPSVLDAKGWVLSSLGIFLVKSFFSALSNVSNSIPFYPTIFLWKLKVLSKVRVFAWLVTHKKVNISDMFKLRRSFKAVSLDWCILYRRSREMIDHLFFHCPITLGLWHSIFSQARMTWVSSDSICDMMRISSKCFGNSIRVKTLWRNLCLSLLWILWRERNARIFEDTWKTPKMM